MRSATAGGMDGQLCSRQSKNQPSVACVDMWKPEHLTEEIAQAFGPARKDDDMSSGDHLLAIVSPPPDSPCAPLMHAGAATPIPRTHPKGRSPILLKCACHG